MAQPTMDQTNDAVAYFKAYAGGDNQSATAQWNPTQVTLAALGYYTGTIRAFGSKLGTSEQKSTGAALHKFLEEYDGLGPDEPMSAHGGPPHINEVMRKALQAALSASHAGVSQDGTPAPHQADGSNPSSSSSGMQTYTVKKGDSLSAIADRFGVSLSAIEQANPQIPDFDLIYPGQQVYIPGQSSQGTSVAYTPAASSYDGGGSGASDSGYGAPVHHDGGGSGGSGNPPPKKMGLAAKAGIGLAGAGAAWLAYNKLLK